MTGMVQAAVVPRLVVVEEGEVTLGAMLVVYRAEGMEEHTVREEVTGTGEEVEGEDMVAMDEGSKMDTRSTASPGW